MARRIGMLKSGLLKSVAPGRGGFLYSRLPLHQDRDEAATLSISRSENRLPRPSACWARSTTPSFWPAASR